MQFVEDLEIGSEVKVNLDRLGSRADSTPAIVFISGVLVRAKLTWLHIYPIGYNIGYWEFMFLTKIGVPSSDEMLVKGK